jgi:drug/metabolite transporter (DMT)-like permease
VRRALGTLVLTAVALTAFAGNSVLCRLALGAHTIDAAGFTAVRIAAGAIVLALLRALTRPSGEPRHDPLAPLLLFAYAAAFSFAYRSLAAGTGALILFGAVQATMMIAALLASERPRPVEIAGLLIALAGLVYLVLPGLHAPSPVGATLMACAGVAWGFYSVRGRGSRAPLADTAWNFAWALPVALAVLFLDRGELHVTAGGAGWAALSGAITSGLGYVVWYAALGRLTTVRAATVQLAVPVLAALGGVVFLGERVTLRLLVAALLILGGIGVTLWARLLPRTTR